MLPVQASSVNYMCTKHVNTRPRYGREDQACPCPSRPGVEALRAAGFDDRDILTIAASAAYESFLCGVAAGLGP